MAHMHFGRSFEGPGPLEAGCPCKKAPCGLVNQVSEECDQHPMEKFQTIRSAHLADECPGAPEDDPRPSLAEIDKAVSEASPGPWEAGNYYHVQGADMCRCDPSRGPLVGIDPDGEYGEMHVHRRSEPWLEYGIRSRDDSVGGYEIVVETEEYGLMDDKDREFVVLARTAVPALSEAIRDVLALHDAGGERWEGFPRADRRVAYCTRDGEAAPCSTVRAITEHIDITPKEN